MRLTFPSDGPNAVAPGTFRRGLLAGAHFFAGMLGGVLLLASLYAGSSEVRAVIGHAQGGASSHAGHAIRQPFADSNGLVAWYPLDGNADDASGNGNGGTAYLAGTGDGYVPGKFGKALEFNGTSDYVSVPNSNNVNVTSQITIEAWIYKTASTYQFAPIVAKWIGFQNASYGLSLDSPNSIRLFLTIGGAYYNFNGSVAIPNNAWTQVAATYDGSSVRLFINGVQIYATSATGSISTNSQPISIGQDWDGTWLGSLDDVRLYSRALSATEISELYQGSQPLNCDQTCVGWWKLDGSGTSTVAADSTSNGNTGTLNGFTFDGTTNGWVPGVFGNGLLFNGSSDYVSLGTPSIAGSAGMTVSFWIKTTSAVAGFPVHAQIGYLNPPFYVFYADGNMSLSVVSPGGLGGYREAYINTSVNDGSWHLFTGTYNGSTVAVYVDGRLANWVGFAPAANISSTANSMVMGGSGSSGFYGALDDVRIYSRALAPYEIYEQYSAGHS